MLIIGSRRSKAYNYIQVAEGKQDTASGRETQRQLPAQIMDKESKTAPECRTSESLTEQEPENKKQKCVNHPKRKGGRQIIDDSNKRRSVFASLDASQLLHKISQEHNTTIIDALDIIAKFYKENH